MMLTLKVKGRFKACIQAAGKQVISNIFAVNGSGGSILGIKEQKISGE